MDRRGPSKRQVRGLVAVLVLLMAVFLVIGVLAGDADWISAGASLAAAVLAGVALYVAFEAEKNAAETAGLERQKVLGSAVGLLDLSGYTAPGGERGLLARVADFMDERRRPRLIEAHLCDDEGSEFGAPHPSLAFYARGARQDWYLSWGDVLPVHGEEIKGSVIPDHEDGALGIFFVLRPEEEARLQSAHGDWLGPNSRRLPPGVALHIVVEDPLGQSLHRMGVHSFVYLGE